ncbi:unnamed protein product [Ectocarpus sp. 13 AM-2016]
MSTFVADAASTAQIHGKLYRQQYGVSQFCQVRFRSVNILSAQSGVRRSGEHQLLPKQLLQHGCNTTREILYIPNGPNQNQNLRNMKKNSPLHLVKKKQGAAPTLVCACPLASVANIAKNCRRRCTCSST